MRTWPSPCTARRRCWRMTREAPACAAGHDSVLKTLTREPLMDGSALLTDLYQLTMAYGYWKTGRADHEAVFHLFYRKPPFGGGYTIACGLEPVIDWLQNFRFAPDDLGFLATLTGNDAKPLFEGAFPA